MAMHLRTGLALINVAAPKARLAGALVVAVTTALAGAGCVAFGNTSGEPSGAEGAGGDGPANNPASNPSGGPGGTQGTPDGDDGSKLPCDVSAALAKNCQSCHAQAPKFGAPMALVTYDDLMKPAVSDPAKKVYELVETRVHSADQPMPPPPNKALDQSSLDAIDAWIKGGAKPVSDANCGGAGGGGDPGGPKLSCTPDFAIKPPTPIQVGNSEVNEYVCYGIDVDLKQKRHVIGLAPRIDNAAVVHHLLLFQADQAYSKTPQPCAPSARQSGASSRAGPPAARRWSYPPRPASPRRWAPRTGSCRCTTTTRSAPRASWTAAVTTCARPKSSATTTPT